eukprot:1186918-Prorocentrum_minimum.AAC.1
MAIVWMIMIPVGVAVSRYCKFLRKSLTAHPLRLWLAGAPPGHHERGRLLHLAVCHHVDGVRTLRQTSNQLRKLHRGLRAQATPQSRDPAHARRRRADCARPLRKVRAVRWPHSCDESRPMFLLVPDVLARAVRAVRCPRSCGESRRIPSLVQ